MVLIFKYLEDVKDVNSFSVVDKKRLVKGNAETLHFQLIQDRSDSQSQSIRYMAQVGATMSVKFDNIDTGKSVTRVATQAFPSDASIWKVEVLVGDVIAGQMVATLTEGVNSKTVMPASSLSQVDASGKFFC